MKNKLIALMAAIMMLFQVIAPAMAAEKPVSATETNPTVTYVQSSAYRSSKYYTQLTSLALTGNQRTDLVNVAKTQIGYHEGNNSSELDGSNSSGTQNYSEAGYWFGMEVKQQGYGHFYDWCAMFVAWCARQAGISTDVISNAAYAAPSNTAYRFKNLTVHERDGYIPEAGDLIFFDHDGVYDTWDHVGIVESVDANYVYTIEGNSNNMVAQRTYALNDAEIRAYGVPMYATRGFSPRTSAPDSSNNYYKHTSYGGVNECILINSNTGSCLPNCVGYAWGRAYEILGSRPNLSKGNAKLWFGYNQNGGYYPYSTDVTQPKLGAICCWTNSSAGHVAVVEAINGDGTITTSESNYGGTYWFTSTRKTTTANLERTDWGASEKLTFQGYIYVCDGPDPDPTPTAQVNWTDYSAKPTAIYATNALLSQTVTWNSAAGGSSACTKVKVYLYNGNTGNLIASKEETPTNVGYKVNM